jgi:hypothetical protein
LSSKIFNENKLIENFNTAKGKGKAAKATKAAKAAKATKATKAAKSKGKSDSKKTKKKSSQKGGTIEIDYLNQIISNSDDDTLDTNELEENMGRIDSDDDVNVNGVEDGYIDLNNLSIK